MMTRAMCLALCMRSEALLSGVPVCMAAHLVVAAHHHCTRHSPNVLLFAAAIVVDCAAAQVGEALLRGEPAPDWTNGLPKFFFVGARAIAHLYGVTTREFDLQGAAPTDAIPQIARQKPANFHLRVNQKGGGDQAHHSHPTRQLPAHKQAEAAALCRLAVQAVCEADPERAADAAAWDNIFSKMDAQARSTCGDQQPASPQPAASDSSPSLEECGTPPTAPGSSNDGVDYQTWPGSSGGKTTGGGYGSQVLECFKFPLSQGPVYASFRPGGDGPLYTFGGEDGMFAVTQNAGGNGALKYTGFIGPGTHANGRQTDLSSEFWHHVGSKTEPNQTDSGVVINMIASRMLFEDSMRIIMANRQARWRNTAFLDDLVKILELLKDPENRPDDSLPPVCEQPASMSGLSEERHTVAPYLIVERLGGRANMFSTVLYTIQRVSEATVGLGCSSGVTWVYA